MKLILLSDIHANLSALKSVIEDFSKQYAPNGILLLGDIINYGMRPNEVISLLQGIDIPVIANIFGNHEKALLDGDTSHFSTERGKQLLEYTKSILNTESIDYIIKNCSGKGYVEIELCGKCILVIHGTLSDPFWGKMTDAEMSDSKYSKYDYVLSGHTHNRHLIEKFYSCSSTEYRNRKKTVFINPGSVGQPRNHNPKAQYAYLDLEDEVFHFNSIDYDITTEQVLYPENIDRFYSERLVRGI
jgi:putative phosphoesterase